MRRRIFNVLAILSLLLCVATVVMWVRSYWASDAFSMPVPQFGDDTAADSIQGYTGRGGMLLGFQRWAEYRVGVRLPTRIFQNHPVLSYGTRGNPYYPRRLNLQHPQVRGIRGAGFEFTASSDRDMSGVGGKIYQQFYMVTPCWFWTALFAAGPMISFLRNRRRQQLVARIANGLCPTCGYDLRATPERCPECGTVASGDPRTASST